VDELTSSRAASDRAPYPRSQPPGSSEFTSDGAGDPLLLEKLDPLDLLPLELALLELPEVELATVNSGPESL